jgi:hypothetical protein
MAQPLSLCLKVSAPTRRGDRLRILISTNRCGCKLRHGLALVVGLQPRTSGTDQAVRARGESCAGRQWRRRPGPDAGRAGAGTRTSLPQRGTSTFPRFSASYLEPCPRRRTASRRRPGLGRRSGPGRRRGMRQTVAMSITRRRLGTGPTATSSTPPAEESPRLLPVERVDLGGLLEAPQPSDPDPEVTRLHRRPLRSPAVED